jgi:hypothetical protein
MILKPALIEHEISGMWTFLKIVLFSSTNEEK